MADSLTRLPREIPVLIGKYLEHNYSNSLLALACANKHCFSTLSVVLFQTLKFFIDDLESGQLAKDVHYYSQSLRAQCGGVCRLVIMHSDKKEGSMMYEYPRLSLERRHQNRQSHGRRLTPLETLGHEEDLLEVYTNMSGSQTSRDTVHETNHLWEPLANLIPQLPLLESVFYHGFSQFPPCLLDCLHQHRPQCRLYITRFNLWSLGSRGPEDDYEMTLLSSPCLYGIGTGFRGTYGYSPGTELENDRWYLPEALRCLVTGMTPHLKKMTVVENEWPASPAGPEPRPPWNGFREQLAHTNTRGSLEYLHMSGCVTDLWRDAFKKWNQDTDFRALKTLKINATLVPNALEYMAMECQFSSLAHLEVDFNLYDESEFTTEYLTTVSSFLTNLPVLSVLIVRGWHSDFATYSILEHHGPRLIRLSMIPVSGQTMSLQDLNCLIEKCPLLEELSIRIKRSRGDAQEVSIYRTIDSLLYLRYLDLQLDASDPDVISEVDGHDDDNFLEIYNNSSFDILDQQNQEESNLYDDHLRNTFINGALDRDLAESIFRTITSGKRPSVLQSMDIQVTGAGYSSPSQGQIAGFQDVLEVLGQPHRVFRSDDGILRVERVEVLYWVFKHSSFSYMLPYVRHIFKQLWPPKADNWYESWHSFPLAVEDNGS